MSFASNTTSHHARRRTARTREVSRAIANTLEALEARKLLASVAVGQIAVYEGPDGPVRIAVSGSGGASFDFIGSTRADGDPRLNDIPMTIYDATTGNVIRHILGGYGGRDGIETIDRVTGTPNGGGGLLTGTDDPYRFGAGDLNNIGGLASNSRGRTYGVNVWQNGPFDSNVHLLIIDNTTGRVTRVLERENDVADIMLDELREVNPAFADGDILNVIGADFDPGDDDTLYFAVNVNFPFQTGTGSPPTFTREEVPAMFTYKISTGEIELQPGFFGVSRQEDEVRVDSFTFLDDGTVAFFGSFQFAGQPAAREGMFYANKNAISPGEVQIISGFVDGTEEELTELAAIESIPGQNTIMAITSQDADARLIAINISTGRFIDFGSAVDVDEPQAVQNRLGQNISDLDFNKRMVDQFFQPGKRGVLMGVDIVRDRLLGIEQRERFQTPELYAILGQNVLPDTSVSISTATIDPNTNLGLYERLFRGVMTPYTGTAGVIKIAGVDIPVDNGGLYLGARSLDANDVLSIPVETLNTRTQFAGNRPGVTLPTILRPGVYVTGTMDKFLFGGTITGSINIDGSIDTFYAGNIITGSTTNTQTGVPNNGTDNFFVNGDMRQLLVRGSFGRLAAAPDSYNPSTDLHMNGRVQTIKVGGDFRGSADIGGKTSEQSITSYVDELETTVHSGVNSAPGLAFEARGTRNTPNINNGQNPFLFAGGNSSTREYAVLDALTENDTFDSPQILGSYFDRDRRVNGSVTVSGNLNNGPSFNDSVDFYGIPLLAGQTIQVGLQSLNLSFPTLLSVMDPDGRVYAEDSSNANAALFLNQRMSVTADKPGIWRLRVSVKPPLSTALSNIFRPYLLTVDKAGELGLGGIATGGITNMSRSDLGIKVRTGDLGAILAGGALIGTNAGDSVDISRREPRILSSAIADTGSIRSLEGASISQLTNGAFNSFPNFKAPKGSIGLIRANATTAADAFLYFNTVSYATTAFTTGRPADDVTIAGDYQVIETIGDFSAILSTNKGIGVIRVGSVANNIVDLPGFYEINADNTGDDGYIGLIDVLGTFGSFTWGGPAIWAGAGSNIRYMRVGGSVYADYGFGNGQPTVLTGRDREVRVNDDSGATISIRPYAGTVTTTNQVEGGSGTGVGTGVGNDIPDPFGGNGDPSQGSNGIPDPFGGNGNLNIPTNIPDPFGGANNPPGTPTTTTTDVIVGDLRVSAYPVRSGGLVVYDVASTTGVKVAVSRKGGGGSGDIGRITTTAVATTANGALLPLGVPIVNPASPAQELRLNPTRLAPLQFGNGTTLDLIFDGGTINVFDIDTPTAQYSRIQNNTNGELVNINAQSIGFLEAQYLGVARPAGAVKVEGLEDAADSRFTQVSQYPFDQPRNMVFVTRAIDIRSRGPIGNIAIEEVVQNVAANSDKKNDKGVFEGIVAPIYAEGLTFGTDFTGNIRRVDIGEGIAGGVTGTLGNGIYASTSIGLITNANGGGDIRGDIIAGSYIEGIRLTGGSILDADIYTALAAGNTDPSLIGGFDIAREDFRVGLDIFLPVENESLLDGIGDVSITGNGGIINSRFVGYQIGMVSVANTGFGIFTSEFSSTSGGNIKGLSAGGLGIRGVSIEGGSFVGNIIANGTGKVRSISEFASSVRGTEFNYFDSVTGIAPNAANDLHLFLGTTRTKNKVDGTTNDGVIQDTRISSLRDINSVQAWEIQTVNNLLGARPRDDTYPSQINVGGKIGKIKTLRNINGVKVVASNIDTIEAGRDILQFNLTTNQSVGTISAGRNFLGSAEVNINGNGSLNTLRVGRNINGILYAARGIRTIEVGGDLAADGTRGGIRSGADINIVRVGGNIATNGAIRATRTIKLLEVAGDVKEKSYVRARAIGEQDIGGVVFGDIVIG